ncbi:MAG: Ig-like domain-containing protein, partial [Paludibacteraceae bacterium]|nr:Ig-like domain-containing protein [Paludibacteraceae bacterium]
DFNYNTYPNPNYLASQMNGSYYRMNSGAKVKANLNDELVKGAVITVRLYADAATSVQLTKADGTEVNTIPLAADTEFEYSYTVNNASPLLGESAFIIKAADNHAGIASIKVTHTYVANPSSPELSWTDLSGDVTQSALGSTFQHVASSTLSLGAIHYASSNEAVATVAADGTVTPHSAGNTTITATIAADGCYKEESISYDIELTEASLQEAIDATPVGETLTLTHNYSENAVINKAITLDANGYTIDDLTVEFEGDLTLSSKLTVRDFTIYAKAGNTSTPAASGQVRNASELKVNGNAYLLYTVDPSGKVQYGWYDFTVPFPINIVSGIKGIKNGKLKENFRNGVDYAVMEYFGDKQAQGQYPYKKFSGVMQPNKLYTITLDNDSNYNTLRMQKTADGALVASESVMLNQYTEGDAINANWNGVGNGTLHHADADNLSADYVQVYQSGYSNTFLPVLKNDYSFVVGTAFMVQQKGGTMMLNQANGNKPLLAPSRYESAPATAIQIASEGKPFSDQLFITASETGGQAYTPGVDVAKAGELGSASVPQIWTNAYNSSLCVHEAQLINGKAQYKLSIYAPVAGAYTLTSKNIPADYSLYLTQNGMIVSELSDTYTLDLSKGITTEYGLLLTEIYNSPTGIENTQTDKIQTTKIIRNGVLYILHNGKVYNAQGAMVK